MKKNMKNVKFLLAAIVLISSFAVGTVMMQSVNAAHEFVLTATPTPRVEVTYDVASTANVASATEFVAAVENAAIKRIVMTQPITLTATNLTSIYAVSINRSLQIDGNGFKLTHANGNVFKLNSATQASTFQLRNITIEKTAGASASTLISSGSAYWDILLDGVTINSGLEYAHIISGAGNPSIFFRGDNEFLKHNDDFAEIMALVVFEDNSKVVMNEPGAGGTNFWDANNVGAVVHFGENSITEIKGNSSWPIFLYFREYYIHKNADVKLYKDSSTTGVITSDSFSSIIQIDSGAKFVLLNLAGPAYGDQAQKAEITVNPGADVQFIGNRAGVGGGVRFQNANSKLVLNSPTNFNIENKNVAYSAFSSGSTTNQALQIFTSDIGAWDKGVATVPPTVPFPFNGVTLLAGNTTALTGTSSELTSIWNTSNYYKIAKSTRPTISSTDLTFGINRTNPIISTYTPSDATLTYSSSNNSVASVDASGQVTGIAAGTVTITITATSPESVATSTTIQVTITNTPPVITAPGFTQLNLNDPFDPMTGVSANDVEDGVLTNITVTPASINTAVAGVYPLTYSVTDSDNNTTTKTRVILVNNGSYAVGTNYILSASNFTKAIDLVDTADASIKTAAQVALYDKATGVISAGTVNVTNIGGYNATVGTYNITFAAASEPTLTKTITATVSATAQKAAAKAELDAKADELKAAIDALPGLSSSEKLAAKTSITNELNLAKANVDAATTISSITAAKDAGILAMTQIFDTQQAKSDQTIINAKNSLDQKATELKDAINLLPGLTPEQKTDAINAIDAELVIAKGNVDAATNLTGISSAITNGEAAMTAVYNAYKAISDQAIADAKTAAIAELNQKATTIRAAINNVEGATQADKEAARAELDAVLASGIASVNSSTTFDAITAEKDLSLAAMDAVLFDLEERVNDALRTAKDAAVATLDDRLAAAKAAVNALANLSPAEKAAAIQELDDAYLIAETAIYDATNTSQITAALNNGIRAFDAIVASATLLDAKNLAVTELEAKAAEIKAAIDALPGLTAQEKLDGKAAIDAELVTGTANIQAATTTTFVQGALNVSRAAMDQIYVDLEGTSIQALAAAKTNSVAELTQVAEDAKALIDALPNLSPAEKTAAKDAVDADLATAITAINAAPDLVAVATELNNGIFAIEANVQDAQLLDLKNAAIAELNAKALEASNAIDALANLSAAEKTAAKDAIAAELAAAITSVNGATTAIEIEDFVIAAEEAFTLEVQNATLLNEKNRAKEELTAKAVAIKAAIDLLPGLTPAERDTAKAAIDDELINGSAAIDAGTRIGEVLSALDISKAAMDSIYDNVSAISAQVLAAAKSDAITELQAAADAARAAIDALTNLTIEEKAAAKNAVSSDLNDAIAAVNGATTLEAIALAKDNGVIAINENVAEAELLNAKAGAIAELEERAEQIKVAIDALVGLSAEDKTAAKNAVDAARDSGIADVQAATSIAAVQAAQTAADAAMDKILSDLEAALAQELADAKTAAIAELDAKATQALADIDALTTLSASEKQAAKDAITAALNDATTAVNAANTVAEVTAAKDLGIATMDNLVQSATLEDAKLAALAELQAKATAVKNAIDALPGLTVQQKIDGKAAIDAELSTGIANINGATSVANVQTALGNSIDAMDTILADLVAISNETLAADKAAANAALNTAAQAAKDAIDALANLSVAEKAAAKAAIDAELATAITAVENATNPSEISTAKNTGLYAIQQELAAAELLNAKNAAKTELAQKALEAEAAINLLQNLTPAEKTAALDQIAAQKAAAITAVDAAKTISEVTDARNDGVGDFEQTVLDAQLLDAKNAAIANLQTSAQTAKDAIDALPNLTAQEKTDAKNAIDAELAAAIAAVEAATDVAEVQTALTDGTSAINQIVEAATLTDAKIGAKAELAATAQAAKDAIDALPNLTAQEKTDAKNAIDTELATAIAAVDAAVNITAIGTAVADGTAAINQIVDDATLADAKILAKADLEAKAQEVIAAINALSGLTDAEKAAGITAINNELSSGLAAIDQGTTLASVNGALATSTAAMDQILADLISTSNRVVEDARNAAIAALEQKAAEVKAAIDALPGLTDEEKIAGRALVDAELVLGLAAIRSATTLNEVNGALATSTTAMDNILLGLTNSSNQVIVNAKREALAELDANAAAAKAIINALPNLSTAERDAAIAAVDAALNTAKQAVSDATTPTEIGVALNAGNANIAEVVVEAQILDAKNGSTAALEQKAADVKAAIDALPGLTDEEKTAGKALIDAELVAGLAAINAGTSVLEIRAAETTSGANMDEIFISLSGTSAEVVAAAKAAAIAELNQNAEEAKRIINELTNLTPEERSAALAAVDSNLAAAIQAVNDAVTPSEVAVALNTGNADIATDVVDTQVQDAKNDSKAALQQKALDVKAAIDALPGLTDAEKAAGKALIDAELANGLAAIDAETTVLGVRAAATTSSAAMDQVLSDLLDQSNAVILAAKIAAMAELEQRATELKNTIDAMPGLNDEQRAAAKQAIDEELARGVIAINAGTTLAEISSATTAAKAAMEQVLSNLEAVQEAKNASKAALEQRATEIKNAIDAMPGLSDEQRAAAKQVIDEELARGIAAINAGTTLADVTAATTAAKAAMESVLPKPAILAPIFTEVKINDVLDLLSGVSAHDLQEGDITSKISVQGNVDMSSAGIYVVTYSVVDRDGNSASTTCVFLVNDGTFSADNNLIITAKGFELYDDEINKTDAEFVSLAKVRVYNVITQEWVSNPTISVDRGQVQGKKGVYEIRFTHNPSIVVTLTVLSRTKEIPKTGDTSALIGAPIVLVGVSLVLLAYLGRKRKEEKIG